jgi:Tfp pilus assembly protein PilF
LIIAQLAVFECAAKLAAVVCGMVSRMATERAEQLKSILAQDPKSTFARYALAMEYMSAGETEAALGEFRAVLEVDANYSNAWFMGAQALQHAARTPEAMQWLRDGIASAKRSGNRHAENEMQSLLGELEDFQR